MKPKLSIIIPCYNCSKTLKEAVDSCFNQGLDDFEIIIVDDKSNDFTVDIMKKLAETHAEIKLAFHNKNQGGGATRNTAVSKTTASYIFCLDSDDVLPPKMLKKMFDFMLEQKVDGVVFNDSKSFQYKINVNKPLKFDVPLNRVINLHDIFSGKPYGTGANFLFTKEAFTISGGYPTHHNFDTQGFGIRFIINGFKAYTCPGSFFYQRQFTSEYSYFERSRNAGEFNLGYYFMFREMAHLFTQETNKVLGTYELFAGNNKLGNSDILKTFIELGKNCKIYTDDYADYVRPHGCEYYLKNHINPFVKANYDLLQKKYISATQSLIDIQKKQPEMMSTKNLIYETAMMLFANKHEHVSISDVNLLLREMTIYPTIFGNRRKNIFERIILKLKKAYKK